jgi:hypothetical protein
MKLSLLAVSISTKLARRDRGGKNEKGSRRREKEEEPLLFGKRMEWGMVL